MRIVFTTNARHDLVDLKRYSEKAWGKEQAHRFSRQLNSRINRLKDFPHLGALRIDFERGYRSIQVGPYLVIYEVIDRDVVIERIVHERRHPSILSWESSVLDEDSE